MTRARVVLLTHGVSQDSTRVRIAHGAQVDPALGAAQVGKVRDPHPIQGALIPLARAAVLMGHRTPPAAPSWARVRVQAREALAAHRRGDRPHPHIHARAHQSMADTRSPIRATGDLVLPGHCLIQTPVRQRAPTPLGCSVFPRVIACARNPQNLGHQGDRGGSPCARPSVQTAGVLVHGGEEGAGFSQKLVLLLQLAHPPTGRGDLSFHLTRIRTRLLGGLAPLTLDFDPPAHHRFTQPSIPGHRRNRRPRIHHQSRNITTILRRQTTTSSHTRHLTGRRHTHPLHEVSTTQA